MNRGGCCGSDLIRALACRSISCQVVSTQLPMGSSLPEAVIPTNTRISPRFPPCFLNLVPSARTTPSPHKPNPNLEYKTAKEFEKGIGEPAVLLDAEHLCFFAPKRRAKEAGIVLEYLTKAYDALYEIVGTHTEYKIAVYAFPEDHPEGWGGTSNCSIKYDESNLDLEQFPEWTQHRVPHVSGYIEEIAHNFVGTTKAQFGWEMLGWSIGTIASHKVANNPKYRNQVQKTREGQRQTYTRYVQNGCILPADIPPNKCDRIHAWILFQCAKDYGPGFWKDFFREIRKEAKPLKDALHVGDGDQIRNARYRITIECFDRLSEKLAFKERLEKAGISTTVDVKSLHPEEPGWDRRLTN